MPRLPVVSGAKVVKALSRLGYDVDHQTGSHIILRQRSEPHRRLTVPNHRELAKGTLRAIIRDAGLTVEESAAISPPVEISASTMLEVIDYVSEASKEGRPKDEMLTNVYLMLDRQFEQSIVKGIRDAREGRYGAVPKGEEPVEFLRKLAAGV